MAREESDREDLLRDASALIERIELAPANSDVGDHVVMGFRNDGAMSVYFGSDAAYHFNRKGQLRRAFCDGLLVKAENQRLVSMQRLRQGNEVTLLRHNMLDEEQSEFLFGMLKRLRELMQQCSRHALVTVGQVPADAKVLDRAMKWLDSHDEAQIARSPHAR